MKFLTLHYKKTSLITDNELVITGKKLQPEIERIQSAIKTKYETNYASINLIYDELLQKKVATIVKEKKALKPTALVVIGIGGSNLGTIAVQEALYGTFYNQQDPEIKIYFADTIDTDYILDIILLIEQELEKNHNVIINVVSKSGTTTETIANFELFLHILKKARKSDFQKYIVITTDKESKLWHFAHEHGFACLEVPEHVGGRYSVFSAVSLFPLSMINVDIQKLHNGAQSIMPALTNNDIYHNPAALSAAILYMYYKKGITIHNTFLFSVDLEGVGKWYRQLMGESLGKELDTSQKQVFTGITPTVSIGSIDLQSVAQLYLGGPYDKFTTFISVNKNKSNLVLPMLPKFENLVPKIQGKSLPSIMHAILHGIQEAYYKNKRPFASIELPEKSAYYIGQLMQLKILEIIYLGYLLEINPFDQPNVELYKKETREILAHE